MPDAFFLNEDDTELLQWMLKKARNERINSINSQSARGIEEQEQPTSEMYIAKVGTAGVTAMTAGTPDHPGTGLCDIYRILFESGGVISLRQVAVSQKKIYNLTGTALTSGQLVTIQRDKFGTWTYSTSNKSPWKNYVHCCATGNVTLSTLMVGSVVDGFTLTTAGMRVLLPFQTNTLENGIYTVESSAVPERAADADEMNELVGACCYVMGGVLYGRSIWLCYSPQEPQIPGTNATFWTYIYPPSYATWHQTGEISNADQILGDGDKTMPDRFVVNYDRTRDAVTGGTGGPTGKFAVQIKGADYNPSGTGLYTPILHPDDLVTVGSGGGAGVSAYYPLPFVAVGKFTIPDPVGATGQIVAPVFDDTVAYPASYGPGTPLCVSGAITTPELRLHTMDWNGSHDASSYLAIFSAFGTIASSRLILGGGPNTATRCGGVMIRSLLGINQPIRSYTGGGVGGVDMLTAGTNYYLGKTENVVVGDGAGGTKTLKFVNGVYVDPTAIADA